MKKILIITGFYLPGVKGGGPIQSIRNLVDILGEKIQFKILTQDRDLGDEKEYPNIEKNTWIKNGKAEVYYCNRKELYSVKFLLSFFRNLDIDIIYLNSFFSITSILIVILNRIGFLKGKKIILAPRGEFSSGALNIKKVKKSIYLKITRNLKIYNDIFWHLTNKEEYEDVKKIFLMKKYKIITNLKNIIIQENKKEKEEKKIDLIFISRIARMKNLKFILEVLEKIDYLGINLDIYGPIEDNDYWKKCKKNITNLKNVKVNYKGKVENEKVLKTISNYHFLILPTLGENYGHIIIESLMASTPVVISNNTPWHNIEQNKIGFEIELENKDKWIETIQKLYFLNQKDYTSYKNNCVQFMKNYKQNQLKKEILKYLEMFEENN